MARSALLSWLQRIASETRNVAGEPPPATALLRREHAVSRRAFIRAMAGLGAWSALPALGARCF